MSATLTINLKDNASPGLQELEDQLAQTGEATGAVAADTRQLTAAQQEQIKVIHEHRAAWSQLAATVGPILANLAQGAGTVGLAYWQLRGRAQALAASKQLVASAGLRVLGVLTGLGSVVTGAVVAEKAFAAALQRTGVELDTTSELARTNAATIDALRAQIVNAGEDWEAYALQEREFLEELGVAVTTNSDRIRQSLAELGGTVARPFQEGARYAREWAGEIAILEDLWNRLDRDLTAGTKNFQANAGALSELLNSISDARVGDLSQAFGGENAADVERQLQAYRELAKTQAEIDRKQADSRDDFDRLQQANAGYAEQLQRTAEIQRLQSVETLAAIEGEIQKQKELAGQRAAANRFDEQAQAAYLDNLAILEQRRTQIVRQETEKQQRLRDEVRKETEQRERESLERRAQNENDALRRSVERYNQWAEDVRASQRRLNDFAQDYADQANNALLNNLIARLDAEGDHAEEAHTARKKLIQQETDQRIAAADTQEERERAFYQGLMRLQREELAHNQRVIREEVATRKQAAAEALRIEQAKKDELTRLLQDAGGPQGADLLGQVDPRKALQDRRGKAAADAARNRVLNDPRHQQLREQGLTSVEASNRLRRMQEQAAKAAEREARAGAFRDFNRGKVDPRELAQAQQQAGQQLLQTMGQNGKLSGDVVQILQQQLQAAADQQGTLATLQQQVAQLAAASRAIGNGARSQRQRAQQGSVQ